MCTCLLLVLTRRKSGQDCCGKHCLNLSSRGFYTSPLFTRIINDDTVAHKARMQPPYWIGWDQCMAGSSSGHAQNCLIEYRFARDLTLWRCIDPGNKPEYWWFPRNRCVQLRSWDEKVVRHLREDTLRFVFSSRMYVFLKSLSSTFPPESASWAAPRGQCL